MNDAQNSRLEGVNVIHTVISSQIIHYLKRRYKLYKQI